MTAREWLDTIEASASHAYVSQHCLCGECSCVRAVPALVAALRAVLDLAVERGDHDPTEWVHVRAIRVAIDTHLGGAS